MEGHSPFRSHALTSTAGSTGKHVVERNPDEGEIPSVPVALDQAKKKTLPTYPFEAGQQLLPGLIHRLRRKQKIKGDAYRKRDRKEQAACVAERCE